MKQPNLGLAANLCLAVFVLLLAGVSGCLDPASSGGRTAGDEVVAGTVAQQTAEPDSVVETAIFAVG